MLRLADLVMRMLGFGVSFHIGVVIHFVSMYSMVGKAFFISSLGLSRYQ